MSEKIPNSRRYLDIAIDRILGKETNPLQVRTVLANTIISLIFRLHLQVLHHSKYDVP